MWIASRVIEKFYISLEKSLSARRAARGAERKDAEQSSFQRGADARRPAELAAAERAMLHYDWLRFLKRSLSNGLGKA